MSDYRPGTYVAVDVRRFIDAVKGLSETLPPIDPVRAGLIYSRDMVMVPDDHGREMPIPGTWWVTVFVDVDTGADGWDAAPYVADNIGRRWVAGSVDPLTDRGHFRIVLEPVSEPDIDQMMAALGGTV